jgi:hypothetical protein
MTKPAASDSPPPSPAVAPRRGPGAGAAAAALLWAALAVNVVVWLRRIAGAVRFDRPFLGATSGGEEETLLSVWKAVHGLPVYGDPWQPPFTVSPYGWLFFHAHAVWSRIWLAACGLDDAWLPTVSRGFTLVGTAVAIAALRGVLRATPGGGGRPAWPLAAVAIVNPLFHWWSFTTRPDVWALAFELVALAAAARALVSDRFSRLLPVAAACSLAWAFRQSSVSVLVAVGMALVLAGRWRHLAALVAIMAAVFGITFAVLGRDFWESAIVAMALAGDMDVGRGLRIGVAALAKDPLLAVSAAALVPAAIGWRRWWHDPVVRLLVIAGVGAAGFQLALAGRSGADTNYLFPAAAVLPAAALATAGSGPGGGRRRDLLIATAAAGLLAAAALVLVGGRGRLAPAADDGMHRLRALRDRLPRPVFCTHVAANVPWVLGDGADSMVVGFPYEGMLRARPDRFTAGTVERMLHDGGFATLVFAERHGRWDEADANLADYEPGPECPGFRIFVRRQPPGPR